MELNAALRHSAPSVSESEDYLRMVRDPAYNFRYVNVPIPNRRTTPNKRTSEDSDYCEMRSSSPGSPDSNPDEIEMKPMLTSAGTMKINSLAHSSDCWLFLKSLKFL